MQQSDCFELGYVTRPFGLNGELEVYLDTDDPTPYEGVEVVFLQKQEGLVPFFVKHLVAHRKNHILGLEDVISREQAEALQGVKLFLPITLLPELPEGEFYWHELVGCQLFNEGALVGTVKGIVDIPGNELVEVDASGREILLPMSANFLEKFSREEKKIFMKLPEGLLEL